MTLHLVKLAVGIDDVDHLARVQQRRRTEAIRAGRGDRLWHLTRNAPRRADELLDGGSIYWVIRGQIRCRQRLVGIEPAVDSDGRPCNRLLLDPELVRTLPRAHRPFQGWRYLAPEDAPPDLDALPSGAEEMPPEMAAELHALGLI